VAIFIACIGLFGLATFSIGKRIREIGIRKVLGSTSSGVVSFLVWQFLKMIILSMVIAVPISWWLITKWLQNFMTPAGHSVWLYIVSSTIVLGIAILTVVYHSTKAANTNPADVLKYE
jgi:putative ABC transport system permease protein